MKKIVKMMEKMNKELEPLKVEAEEFEKKWREKMDYKVKPDFFVCLKSIVDTFTSRGDLPP